jgi:hypothetical protein
MPGSLNSQLLQGSQSGVSLSSSAKLKARLGTNCQEKYVKSHQSNFSCLWTLNLLVIIKIKLVSIIINHHFLKGALDFR